MITENGIDENKWSEVQALIHNTLDKGGFELVNLQLKRAKGKYILRIFIDTPNGVTIDDCESISNSTSSFLDEFDFIPGPYVLEVSSPGLDRPLHKERDFIRYMGHKMKVTFKTSDQKSETITGRILSLNEGILTIEADKKRECKIPFMSILEGRLIIDF